MNIIFSSEKLYVNFARDKYARYLNVHPSFSKSRDSSVGIVTGCGLYGRGSILSLFIAVWLRPTQPPVHWLLGVN
jgi:hypothetical protein